MTKHKMHSTRLTNEDTLPVDPMQNVFIQSIEHNLSLKGFVNAHKADINRFTKVGNIQPTKCAIPVY
jgi:hypothetical protein